VLRRLPALGLVAFTGTGAATFVDLPAARECGIAVANVPHYGDAAVAEHALALALALAKSVVANDRAVRAGEWHVGQGIELAGKTAGIIGYGGIGARLAGLPGRQHGARAGHDLGRARHRHLLGRRRRNLQQIRSRQEPTFGK
jgi:lactate dehydrogenase-like 2-hydroxyacid dehydrogenase